MTATLRVKTVFDCTRTGITGRFRPEMLPFQDKAGQPITCEAEWNRSRNQQRNFETLQQTIGMRTQLLEVSDPLCQDQHWHFEVVPDRVDAFGHELRDLLDDCHNVPMMSDVTSPSNRQTQLSAQGTALNIWFDLINS